jgi:hypothetical protein
LGIDAKETPSHLPPRTRDAGLALSLDETFAGDVSTALTVAGFTEEFFGDDSPPATHYRLGEEDAGFYAELLTPLIGSEMKRGKRETTASRAGITSQKLRCLDVLTSFMVQKLLIRSTRRPEVRAVPYACQFVSSGG